MMAVIARALPARCAETQVLSSSIVELREAPGHGRSPAARRKVVDAAGSMIAFRRQDAIIASVNGTHRKTLERVLADPVNGNIEWARIESLLKAAGCRVVEGAGSSVTFEFNGRKMTLHRPHPGKDALRYRVLAVREFIERMGIKP